MYNRIKNRLTQLLWLSVDVEKEATEKGKGKETLQEHAWESLPSKTKL
jgi:hypothetical protein